MNEIVKREPTQVAVDGWDDTAAEAETRLIRGSLLRFADWKWSIGKEAIEVKEGRQLVTVATTAAWVKWREGKRVDYRLRESGGRLQTVTSLATTIELNGSSALTAKKCVTRGKTPASSTCSIR